ncbi:MAG: FtsW/RodA/SpoVE family cell cycle protein [Eubacteriales bacterium]|nr:FtsW/RodA/SpoVE family cell cycle protein [Eubacteriales bacterium]
MAIGSKGKIMQTLSNRRNKTESFFEDLDYRLLVPVVIMTVIGLYVMNLVLQAGYGAGSYPANFYKQTGAVVMGLLLALLVTLIDYPTLKLLSWLVYAVALLLLIYVKVDNFSLAATTGADSWIILPIVGSFQPSELAKVGISMVGAHYFDRMKRGEIPYLRGFFSLALIYGIPVFLIYKEPDLGTSTVIIFMFLVTLFIWGLPARFIVALGLLGVLFIFVLWNFSFSPYMKNRVLALLFPAQGLSESYHLEQALQAIGSGGLLGNRGEVHVYVPVKESDFIYSAIGEHLGWIGTTTLLIVIAIYLVRAVQVAHRAEGHDYYASYLMMALVASQLIHFVENMGMNVGLLPITGIPLPFISSGGTAMIVNFFALGLMLNISMEFKDYVN